MTPYFDTVASALSMEGHGPFVWSAYAIAAIAIIALLTLPRVKERRELKRIAAQLKRQNSQEGSSVEIS